MRRRRTERRMKRMGVGERLWNWWCRCVFVEVAR